MIKMISDLLFQMMMEVLTALSHNWLTFSLAILLVSVLRAYINVEELKKKLLAKPEVSIMGSVAFGILTPLCAAGSLGLVVGLITTVMPWGPIMAFLTSSPLMSPDAFIMISGVINTKFAIALAVASVIIGVTSGYITHFIEKKTDFLKNQTRYTDSSLPQVCGCNESKPKKISRSCNNVTSIKTLSDCNSHEIKQDAYCCTVNTTLGQTFSTDSSASEQACCSLPQEATRTSLQTRIVIFLKKIKWRDIFNNIVNIGIKNMLVFFSIFVAIGYLVTRFVPTSIIGGLLGSGKFTAVPLAAIIGLPLYITTEASIPLVKALMAQGASAGAMLAFWIAGQTTSAMVIAGLATFMKKRIILLYIFFVVAGAILSGYAFNLILLFWK
ncbi:MAG TPA: permease [Clostridia bacterium]|nr:permease [Clostridia bacterium]